MENNLDEFVKYVDGNQYVNIEFKRHLNMYVEFYRKKKNKAAQDKSTAQFTTEQSDEIKPCSRLSDCSCVRIEGKCKGPSCGVYNPA